MTLGTTEFRTLQACPPVPANAKPIVVRVRADWLIPFAIKDSSVASITVVNVTPFTSLPTVTFAASANGIRALATASLVGGSLVIALANPGSGYDRLNPPAITITGGGGSATATCTVGNQIDLTGAAVGARLYTTSVAPVEMTGLDGKVTITDAVNGRGTILVLRARTNVVPPQSLAASAFPTCLSVYLIDTLGDESIFDPIALLPLTPRDYGPVAIQIAQQNLVTAGQQGPAGASNTYTAGQIEALIASDRAAQHAELLDAVAPLQNHDQVQALILAFFNAQTFAPTGVDLNALIDARVQAALLNYVQLSASIQGMGTLTGALSFSRNFAGSIASGATLAGALSQAFGFSGNLAAGPSLSGMLSLDTPFAGSVGGVATLSGALTLAEAGSIALAGSVQGAGALAGSLSSAISLSGAVPASSGLTGSLSFGISLAGAIPASASLQGTQSYSMVMSGNVPGSATFSSTLSSTRVLVGVVPSSADIEGALFRGDPVVGNIPGIAVLGGSIVKTSPTRSPIFAFGLLDAAA